MERHSDSLTAANLACYDCGALGPCDHDPPTACDDCGDRPCVPCAACGVCPTLETCAVCRSAKAHALIVYRAKLRWFGGAPDLAPELDSIAAQIARLLVGDPLDVEPSPREYRAHSIDAAYRRMHARQAAAVAIARAQRRAA